MDLNHENIPTPLKPKKWNCLRSYKKMLTFEDLSSSVPIYKTSAKVDVKLLKIIHSLLCTMQNPLKWVVRYLKTLLVIYLFVCMLRLLIFSRKIFWIISPSIGSKTSVKLLHTHLYLSWMIKSRLSILESTSFCSFLWNNFMLYLSYFWNDLFSASGI